MFCNRYAWLLSTGYASEKVNSEMCIKYLLNCFAIDMHDYYQRGMHQKRWIVKCVLVPPKLFCNRYAWLLSTGYASEWKWIVKCVLHVPQKRWIVKCVLSKLFCNRYAWLLYYYKRGMHQKRWIVKCVLSTS